MIRIGRFTAALCLVALGVLMLLEHGGIVDVMAVLRTWWPAAVVMLGVEVLILQSIYRREGGRMRPAIGAMLGAVLLGALVLGATRFSDIPFAQWTNGLVWSFNDSENAKFSFDKGVTIVPYQESESRLAISNANGNIVLTQGPVRDIEVKMIAYVNVSDAKEAQRIADESSIEVIEGTHREIVAAAPSYGTGHLKKPRMDVTVTFPEDRVPAALDVNVGNGAIRIDHFTASTELKLDLKNGDITGRGFSGAVRAAVLNGDVDLAQLSGSIKIDITNGDIKLTDPLAAVEATTINGDISIRSSAVGGSWKASATMGDVTLAWPEAAGVSVDAKSNFGDVSSDWPLDMGKHQASGKLGDGRWSIEADTHTDISLKKFQP